MRAKSNMGMSGFAISATYGGRMDFELARTNMVNQQVRPWQVLTNSVLDTLSRVPREMFVPAEYANLAYSDTSIPLNETQTMLPPKIVGRALQSLQLTGKETVLEIGTGTGYLTACLSDLVNKVISVEIDPQLMSIAKKNLAALQKHNITLESGDAVFGWNAFAPYDAIVITGSYPLGVPQLVCDQLKPHGRLFAICGQGAAMQAVLIERHSKEKFSTTILFETSVPALIHAPTPSQFQF
jgi:protein-L-isoaspartate(D-aspartate) O-methyltransferase